MSKIKITHDGSKPGELCERCCMCRTPTLFWYTPKDIALCPSCANTVAVESLPTKAQWWAKELRLNPVPSHKWSNDE